MEFFVKLFDTEGFPPRRYCGAAWTDAHAGLHIVSDFAIFGAYMAIPLLLAIFVVLRRRDAPFPPVFWLFAAFILSCGIGHAIEATIFWHPWYRLSGVIKAITALVSWGTVLALIPVLPKALSLPGLAAINQRLEKEAAVRQAKEQELRAANEELQEFARHALDREDRVIELKHEVNALLSELGRAPIYAPEPIKP